MSSARKTAANGRNAKKSKGPRTVEGRNVARRNALKHGLTAETLVVEGEDADEFRFTADAHGAVFRPRNDVEVELVRTFTIAAWRRQRCASTETAMVNRYIRDSQLAEEVIEQQDALALGDRLFFDSQDLWQLYPDPTMNGAPLSKRRNMAGVGLIRRFSWITYAFGALLVYSGLKLLQQRGTEIHPHPTDQSLRRSPRKPR